MKQILIGRLYAFQIDTNTNKISFNVRELVLEMPEISLRMKRL